MFGSMQYKVAYIQVIVDISLEDLHGCCRLQSTQLRNILALSITIKTFRFTAFKLKQGSSSWPRTKCALVEIVISLLKIVLIS